MDFTFERVVTNTDEDGEEYSFIIPDLVALIKRYISVGDKICLPLAKKKKLITFSELGGRNPEYKSSIATVVAGKNDQLLDALQFNKLSRKPNGKQAFVAVKAGFNVYVGKISTHDNPLAPNIKIIRLTYQEKTHGKPSEGETNPDQQIVYCDFIVSEVYLKYSEIGDNIPAKRLVRKLFTDFVTKPYYVNGWSASDISMLRDKPYITKLYRDIFDQTMLAGPDDDITAEDYLDEVENAVVKVGNDTRLSAVLQFFDFNTGKMSLITTTGLRLNIIEKSFVDLKTHQSFTIDIDEFMGSAYNLTPVFHNDDKDALRMALQYDQKYSICISPDVFALLRAYRG